MLRLYKFHGQKSCQTLDICGNVNPCNPTCYAVHLRPLVRNETNTIDSLRYPRKVETYHLTLFLRVIIVTKRQTPLLMTLEQGMLESEGSTLYEHDSLQ